jgi:hypothetical protein
VETGGDSLCCVALSPSGEALALGGSGGFVHLWSGAATPRIAAHTRPLAHLSHPPPRVRACAARAG